MGRLLRKSSLKSKLWLLLMLLSGVVDAQYAPSAGQAGTTAMHKDSSAFVSWAVSCDVQLGLQDISNSASGDPLVGTSGSVIGVATGSMLVSLGDGGSAVMQFSSPIMNGAGPDFAVFENSFDGEFLELAFVEVSSDGVNYFRFPASSLTQTSTQVGTFELLEAAKINNLAGKYKVNYGTPFDLEELIDEPGLDVNAITHVKVIDVIGAVDPQYASYDTAGNIINDPWPTAFSSSGFDLDAVGVINSVSTGVQGFDESVDVTIFPNPVRTQFSVANVQEKFGVVEVYDLSGSLVLNSESLNYINVASLYAGIYLVKVITNSNVYSQIITILHE